MKKWLFALLMLLVVFFVFTYLLIPNKNQVTESLVVKANQPGFLRVLFAQANWGSWLPNAEAGTGEKNNSFKYKDLTYTIDQQLLYALNITVSKTHPVANTSLNLLAIKLDSTRLEWQAELPASYNPIKRINNYFLAKKLRKDMRSILETMEARFSKIENIYGFNITKAKVTDSTLISTFNVSPGYPSAARIYGLIDQLKHYIAANNAKETGYPMLNIYTTDRINYTTRVAIPVNAKLPGTGDISYKWMLPGGNILITEVKGGPSTIARAYSEIENYVSDYQRSPPAISFESLVTDRRNEPDTNKWVTKIYYPIR